MRQLRVAKQQAFAAAVVFFSGAAAVWGQVPPAPPTSQVVVNVIDLPQAQIRAATDDATANLRQEILAAPLARRLTVGNQLDATGGSSGLDDVLLHARPVGGPRWIAGTCQVQLQISGGPVADLLLRQAAAQPSRSLYPPSALHLRLRYWGDLTFVAVGSSAGGESIDSARPVATGAWASVDADTCHRAVSAARTDAVNRAIDALATLPSPSPQLDLRAALAQPQVRQELTAQLCQQPVTRIEFLDDLHVNVTLVPVPQTLGAGVCQVLAARQPPGARLSPTAAAELYHQIAGRQWSCIGIASAAPAATARAGSSLPAQAPLWINRSLEADAVAEVSGVASPLHVARLAESAAMGRLREQFLALPLEEHQTMNDAVKADPQLGAAVDRALQRAHPTSVDYRADGSVRVRMALDLRQAWDELTMTAP